MDAETVFRFLLRIAIVVPLLLLWAATFIDLVRRQDISIFRKALWATLVVFTAHIGVLIYFILRPVRTPHGKDAGHSADRSSMIVGKLEEMRDLHKRSEIADDAYLEAKRELLGLPTA